MDQLQNIFNTINKNHSISNFIFIYTKEVHASDGWEYQWNRDRKINISQHVKIEDKINACKELIKIWNEQVEGMENAIDSGKIQIVCDDIECQNEKKFNTVPERFVILNKDHTVAMKGGYGPVGFDMSIVDQFFSDK